MVLFSVVNGVNILTILGSLAFFIYGMKMMSDGIQRAAGAQLRKILKTMTKNRFLGVFTGFITTALVQSSSATTVMTVSFVNAGLLTLVESAGVMMGANIGTTITGWIVSFLGFKIKLSAYSIPLFAFGVPMIFASRGKLKYWGEFLIGFAILFLGLSYLKDSVPDLRGNAESLEFLSSFTEWGILSRLFFVLIGTIVTLIVQSSSAAMAITLTLCAQGWLPFEVAASMILGENIGTTITAELASMVGNVNAKRSARIHSMFNIVGVTWMVIILPYFLPFLSSFIQTFMGASDPYLATGMPIGLSAFHTAFNLINVIIMLFFVKFLVKTAVRTVKGTEEDDEEGLKYISAAAKTPELAIVEIHKETARFGEITSKMNKYTRKLLQSKKSKDSRKMLKKLGKYEKITDQMEIQITEYITKISNEEMTPETSLRLRATLNICNDLERVGDVYFQISKAFEQKEEDGLEFTQDQIEYLDKMLDKIDLAFAEMISNLNNETYSISMDKAQIIEKEINLLRDEIKDHNLKRIGDSDYDIPTSMIFNNVYSLLEKVGDHIINVDEAIHGDI